jgi:hypothetical protein
LPTISHLPVTVTGAFELVEAPLFELVFALGLLALAGLFVDVLAEFAVGLPEQPIMTAARTSPRTNDAIFIKCFLLYLRAN